MDMTHLVLHFCSHSGSLKHCPRSVVLRTRLQLLLGEGRGKGCGTATQEASRRERKRDTWTHQISQ